MTTEIQLSPPGPGPWQCDYSHLERPVARYGAALFSRGYTEGQALGFERAGVPIRTIAMKVVDGFPYLQPQPLVGSPASARLPPRWLFKLVSAVHPELRKRMRLARAYVTQKRWRDEVREWDQEIKPRLARRLEELSRCDPAAVDEPALLAHLERCRDVLLETFRAHFAINPTTVVPVGRFLVHAGEWTGAHSAELLALVRHGSSTAEPSLVQLIDVVRAHGQEARITSNDASATEVLAGLLEGDGPVAAAARAWLDAMSVRQICAGDLATPNGGEVPELLVANLRRALDGDARAAGPTIAPDSIRTRVPADRREQFDELLADARHVYRLRDERSTVLDVWAAGLCRRAVLAVGARLAERGALEAADHVLDLDHDELLALASGEPGPNATEIAERRRFRLSHRLTDAPRHLGGEPSPPPPLDYFPPAVREMMRSVTRYLDDMDGASEPAPEPAPGSAAEAILLRGRPASAGRARGPARLVEGPADFGKIHAGDILVARATMPSYNGVLPLLAGIVTDYGGALCHAAIVAREYGIPAVVNTRAATGAIADGTTIEIDGDEGTVRVIET